MRRLGPPNSVTMQTAVTDGNYFEWEWVLFSFRSKSLSIPISIPTIDSTFVPFSWDSRWIPIFSGNPISMVISTHSLTILFAVITVLLLAYRDLRAVPLPARQQKT